MLLLPQFIILSAHGECLQAGNDGLHKLMQHSEEQGPNVYGLFCPING